MLPCTQPRGASPRQEAKRRVDDRLTRAQICAYGNQGLPVRLGPLTNARRLRRVIRPATGWRGVSSRFRSVAPPVDAE